MTIEEISRSLNDVYFGAYSFFPKYGTYNALMSNEGIDLLRSKEIKSLLIELYDYQFKNVITSYSIHYTKLYEPSFL